MSRLNDLLKRLEERDPALAKDLKREVDALSGRRAFGLNFERHVPEAVELPGRPVRRGDKVRVLPPRGSETDVSDNRLWRVLATTKDTDNVRLASIEVLGDADETAIVPVNNLVVIAEFKDPIFPGLVSTGEVKRGGDKPHHAVINAENYHALQTLLFTHRGKVDAIYIDPPYNTGAKDWKYNNNYVESEDLYRHSKWLAFIERRLKLAKELLNPKSSVLIVTIDEKEYLRLGLLLEQTFPETNIQMVTSSIKPSGSQRAGEFSRVEEYIFFVMVGGAYPATSTTDMLRDSGAETKLATVTWQGLRRRGSTDWKRSHRPNGFYPLFISQENGQIHSIGEPIPLDMNRHEVVPPPRTWPAWPLDPSGKEGRWQVSPARLREQLTEGTAALRRVDRSSGGASVVYLKGGDLEAVRSGSFKINGRDEEGKLIILPTAVATRKAKTMWMMPSHDASAHGTALLSRFLPDRKFPFPKSLFAVEDALRFFVGDKPAATVVDFFAGSGTTAHAVMRINKQDGGQRRSISVTNNEVSAAEQKELWKQGLRPGDPSWEERGICDYITKPRIAAAITGRIPAGQTVSGDYKFNDEFPMADGFEENVEFFTLTYEAPLRVSSNREFAKIAPLLWLRAGSKGPRIQDVSSGWATTDTYGVLADLNQLQTFLKVLASKDQLQVAFVVTDEDRLYESVVREIPRHVEVVRLYEAYLQNFEIETGRSVL